MLGGINLKNKDNLNKTNEKKNNKVIFIIVAIIILCIFGFFIYINFFAYANVKSITVKNNQIEDFTISNLKFETQAENNQINIIMSNISDEDLDIKSVIVKITDKEKFNDKIELDYNQVLSSGTAANLSLGYEIKNIDKISFEVVFNK